MTAGGVTDVRVTGVGVVTRDAMNPGSDTPKWFNHRAELGRGYKYLPRASQYLLAATARAIADSGGDLAAIDEHDRAITIGTNNGTSEMQGDFDREIIESSSTLLSPASVPYFSVNLIGSRVAMEHALKGFSLGIHSPRVAGLEAIQQGVRALRTARATWLLTGAAESPLDSAEPGSASSEDGAVALVLEPASAAGGTGRERGSVRVHSFVVAPSATAPQEREARAARLFDDAMHALAVEGSGDLPVTVVGGDDPVTDCIDTAVRRSHQDVTRVAAGAGCLEPALRVAAGLTESSAAQIIVGVAAQGNVSVAHVIPTVQPGA